MGVRHFFLGVTHWKLKCYEIPMGSFEGPISLRKIGGVRLRVGCHSW